VLRFVGKHYFPFTWEGGEQVPAGPLVVAANHLSHLDPVITSLAVGRPIRYLALDELYGRSRVFDGLTLWLGAIPLPRGRVPLGSLRLALAELAAGGTVGLYPEAMRVWTWGEEEPRRGAAWLARRAGVPLLPVAIDGSDQAMGRGTRRIGSHPVHATVCPPIFPGDYQVASDPLAEMMAEWKLRVDAAIAHHRALRSPGA
jgi:1-acyl-sn-glycerol-3-phosphate acyltransferase